MRVDELRSGLTSARDDQLAADALIGRRGVDRHVRRQRAERAGVAVLIVVLLASAGLFVATRGTDEQRVISGPGAIPQYVPEPMLAGPVLLQQYPPPSGPDDAIVGSGELIIWTDDPSSSPTAQTRLLRLLISESEPRGGQMPPELQATDRGFRVSWVEASGTTFSLDAIGASREDVEAAQSSVTVGGDGRASMQAPVGFREVLRRTYDIRRSYPQVPESSITDPDYPGFVAAFEESRYPRTSFSAFATPRAEAWALVVADELEPISIRGRAGFLVRREAQSSSATSVGGPQEAQTIEIAVVLIWWETDSTVLSVTGRTEGEARDLAESLRLADDRTWELFVQSSKPFPSNKSTIFGPTGSSIFSPTTVP